MRLIGTIAGFVPDGDRVRAAFADFGPDRVALGVPPEDLAALEGLWKADEAKGELVEPDVASEQLLKLLHRFGTTRIPSPDLEVAYGLAKAGHVAVESLDLDDATHSAEYVQRVKVRHLWMQPRREKWLLAKTFEDAKDAYDLAVAWDREANGSRPLRQIEALREETMARKLTELAPKAKRILAVVPAARFEGIVQLLRASG